MKKSILIVALVVVFVCSIAVSAFAASSYSNYSLLYHYGVYHQKGSPLATERIQSRERTLYKFKSYTSNTGYFEFDFYPVSNFEAVNGSNLAVENAVYTLAELCGLRLKPSAYEEVTVLSSSDVHLKLTADFISGFNYTWTGTTYAVESPLKPIADITAVNVYGMTSAENWELIEAFPQVNINGIGQNYAWTYDYGNDVQFNHDFNFNYTVTTKNDYQRFRIEIVYDNMFSSTYYHNHWGESVSPTETNTYVFHYWDSYGYSTEHNVASDIYNILYTNFDELIPYLSEIAGDTGDIKALTSVISDYVELIVNYLLNIQADYYADYLEVLGTMLEAMTSMTTDTSKILSFVELLYSKLSFISDTLEYDLSELLVYAQDVNTWLSELFSIVDGIHSDTTYIAESVEVILSYFAASNEQQQRIIELLENISENISIKLDQTIIQTGDDDDGFSLLDLLGTVFKALVSGISSIFSLFTTLLTNIVSRISGLFGSFGDDSEVWNFFNSTDSADVTITGFFVFMRNLWAAFPVMVQRLILFTACLPFLFGALKMLHK